jgi:hypothetical protein
MKIKPVLLIVAAVILVAVVASAAVVFAGDRTSANIRQATTRFQAVDKAEAAGYAKFLDCVSEPGQGAMGVHYVHGDLIGDTVLDPQQPEALMYAPQANGTLKLVGVEYIVFQAAWDSEHPQPPALFGQPFHLVGSPNRYDVPAFYELHVWAWQRNPSGQFNDWNPSVACPG